MLFNSWQYFLFFPILFFLYYIVIYKNKKSSNTVSQILLLAVSLFFYACWNPKYLVLILFSIYVTWLSALVLDTLNKEQTEDKATRIIVLILALIANLSILFFFKYYNFFEKNTSSVLHLLGLNITLPKFNYLLPVGISFYTFQALGYVIDVYRGKVKAEQNIFTYALFVTFFPQRVAGPIERTGNLLPQFKINHEFNYQKVTEGLRLILWGLFKKIVIADRLAVYVNAVYEEPSLYPSTTLALATLFFTFQIYCDFSGYSGIAIGSAKALGFNLMKNFRNPYFAASISDFWRRWHISLSTWFKDYVYLPLGGNRCKKFRHYFNLMVTFIVSGIWHGAGWHFIFWGFLHGIYQVIEKALIDLKVLKNPKQNIIEENLKHFIKICITFILVFFAWIFFRANSMTDAVLICRKIAHLPMDIYKYATNIQSTGLVNTIRLAFNLGNIEQGINEIQGFGIKGCFIAFILIFALLFVDWWTRKEEGSVKVAGFPIVVRWIGYWILAIIIFACMFFIGFNTSEFIYFQF
jgi:D-alanyl-lipoteichoic acid acyltransferase DltB (MBOAT superfamily)